MIKCKDFVPEKKKGGIFKSGSIQHFDEVLVELDEWLAAEKKDIINIEPVLLPKIHASAE